MTREPIEATRQDRIYCLKASSDYHRELCEECRFYPNCDHMTQDDMTELTIKDLEALEQEQDKPMVEIDLYSVIKQKYIERELIDRNDLESTTITTDDYSGNEVLDVVLMEDVKEAPVITEQEIVKPYLEKLRADIEAAYDELDGYDPDSLGTFASRIDDLIDNLLSESEGK